MRRASALLLSPLLPLGACINVEEKIAEDAHDLAAAVKTRTGQESSPPLTRAEDGARSPDLDPLLAGNLSEAAAVKVALLNNRDVRVIYERLGIARAKLVQAGLIANPVFDANARFFKGGTEIELGLAQSFLDIFYAPLRELAASCELEAAKAQLTRELCHLVFDVRRTFVHVRAAMQLVALQEQVQKAAAASYDLMRKLHDAGNVTAPQLTAEGAALARARLDLAAAEQAAREAREPLNVLLGLWGKDTRWSVEGRLADDVAESFDLSELESRSIRASLELAENRARTDAAAQLAGLSSWQGLFPDATLGLEAKREPGNGWGLGPSVAVSLPVFDQGQARIAVADAHVREGVYRQVQIAVEVRSAARLLGERFVLLQDRIAFLRQHYLPLRARLVRETLQNYNAMQIGVFEVLTARQGEVEAGREYLDVLRSAWLARLDLEELLAGSVNRDALAATWPAAHPADLQRPRGH
jgi:cobalt-zinc-cadmium efflux system outer membrane protein